VLFVRSGGFAGLDDHLVIEPDGSATLTRRSSARIETEVTPSELDSLRRALDRIHLPRLGRHQPGPPDTFVYTVTFGGSSVHVAQTAVPPGLRELVGILLEIMNRLAHKG
jgi:hypothetical protein